MAPEGSTRGARPSDLPGGGSPGDREPPTNMAASPSFAVVLGADNAEGGANGSRDANGSLGAPAARGGAHHRAHGHAHALMRRAEGTRLST